MKARPWAVAAGLALAATASPAQGFSCLDACEDSVGIDIIVGGERYELSHCEAIRHDDHYHVDCHYTRA